MKPMNILLVGEYCIDRYHDGHVPRLSPEAPCPVFQIVSTTMNHGMAGNVAANLTAMYPSINLTKTFFDTGVKTRFIDMDSGYQIMRLDEEIKPGEEPSCIVGLPQLASYDAVIISDYNKGFITDDVIKQVISHPHVYVDTKKQDLRVFGNATIKVNKKEYSRLTHHHTGPLIVTMGAQGAQYNGVMYPVGKVDIKDLSGAGDTFLAALAIYHTLGRSLEDSIRVANIAATIAVSKPKTSVVTQQELEAKL